MPATTGDNARTWCYCPTNPFATNVAAPLTRHGTPERLSCQRLGVRMAWRLALINA